MSEMDLEAEVLAEENVEGAAAQPVRAIQPYESPAPPVLRDEIRTAAVAAVGGVLAGAATVAAVRAVGASAPRRSRRLSRRRDRPSQVVASRSFLVDVHLLGR
ncbi:MAG TPA: hypothetical protein VND98_07380 [Solirubrobacterales bacterium]|nr:hypothetical protein [Solirubrobacterales bacterium]